MLTGNQRRYLRAQGNKLEPIIHIGKDGITQAVINQLDELLTDHELIKGRVLNNLSVEAKDIANQLANKCSGDVVQVIGNVFLIFRRNQDESIYQLP